MALWLKPHTLTHIFTSDEHDGMPPVETVGATFLGHCEPMDPKTAFEDYGLSVSEGFMIAAEIIDAAPIEPGHYMMFGAMKMVVLNVQTVENGLPTDHTEIALKRLEYAE